MGETNGLCLKAFSVAFVNGLVVEIHFLIVMCPPTAIVINFVVIPRSGMLGRGTFFLSFFSIGIYTFSKTRIDTDLFHCNRIYSHHFLRSNVWLCFVHKITGLNILTFIGYSLSKSSLKLEEICKHLCRNHNHNPK